MAKVEPSDLVSQFIKLNKEDYRIKEQEKLISQFSENFIFSNFASILETSNSYEDEILKKGIRYGLLGSIYAFKDRDLDPYSQFHFPIFQTIRSDIESAFHEIKPQISDEEFWLFECFDYGIKHVYYLDWTLYLSKSCY